MRSPMPYGTARLPFKSITPAMPHIQFLEAGGRWDELIKFIPLTYSSNNASDPKDVIGTITLSVLNVKRLVQTCLRQSHWEEAGEGWQCLESVLQLKGWSRSRRVILVREFPAVAPRGSPKAPPAGSP